MDIKYSFEEKPTIDQIIGHFKKWFNEEVQVSKVRIPTACCLSTIGLDGFPNARFVSLKDVLENKFVVTGPLTSKKGNEIKAINKVSLTFWWTETERQVRVQGNASKIPDQLADKYFSERSRDSQIVSLVSEQGKEIENIGLLTEKYDSIEEKFTNKALTRPGDWGGYLITPIRIEFLEFKTSRFHVRILFEFANNQWTIKQIQP
jgi:pyridoxamine 5'-phosphate oxidase